jgi:DNA repair protein RadD
MLRPYQQDAVDAIRSSIASGHRAPILCAVTGFGKSVVIGAIAAAAHAKGKRMVVCAHRKELVLQNAAKITSHGVNYGSVCGIIMAGHAPNDAATVHSASIQTLSRRDFDWEPDIIAVDEVQLGLSPSYVALYERWPNALRIGFSGTPCAPNGRGLGKHWDDIVFGRGVRELQADGYLAQIRTYSTPAVADLANLTMTAGDFNNTELAERMKKDGIVGDAIGHYRKLGGGKSAVVFCVNIERSKAACAEFQAAGYRAMHIDGEMPQPERERVLAAVASGECQILTSVDVVSVGFDCPRLKVAIMLRPTASIVVYLQSIGRILRPWQCQEATLIDCVGNVGRHGLPTADRQWTLEDKPKANAADPKDTISPYSCPKCWGMTARPCTHCAHCGYEVPVQDRAIPLTPGELVEIREREIEAAKVAFKRERSACRTFEELVALGKRQGFPSPTVWARYILQAREVRRR